MAEGLAVAGENPQGKVLRGLWKTRGTLQGTPGKPTPFEGPTGHLEERAHPGLRFPEREAPVRIPGLGITPLSTFFF